MNKINYNSSLVHQGSSTYKILHHVVFAMNLSVANNPFFFKFLKLTCHCFVKILILL